MMTNLAYFSQDTTSLDCYSNWVQKVVLIIPILSPSREILFFTATRVTLWNATIVLRANPWVYTKSYCLSLFKQMLNLDVPSGPVQVWKGEMNYTLWPVFQQNLSETLAEPLPWDLWGWTSPLTSYNSESSSYKHEGSRRCPLLGLVRWTEWLTYPQRDQKIQQETG